MGLLSPIQKQFIKRPDEAKDEMVYKWPDNTIRSHTQLTVEPDEEALFVKEGVVKGIVNEGVHSLDGANIPFIGGLINAGTGGNYLASELFFVSIHEFVNRKFGGAIDNVTDPQTELAVGLRCFGEYSIKAIDPQSLVLNLVGTSNISSMDEIDTWVSSQLLKIVREIVIAHVISTDDTKHWDILGIASHNEDIEDESVVHTNVILQSYGLAIGRLGNITISLKDEDAETLKQLKRDLVYGKNMSAADAALKLGAAKGFEEGNGSGATAGLFAAGLGMGYSATNEAVGGMIATNPMKYCTQCGKQITADAKYCPHCGAKQ